MQKYQLLSAGLSDVGLVRKKNEDCWKEVKEFGFYVLADGMGGHNAGDIAATEAVKFLTDSIEELFISPSSSLTPKDLSLQLRHFIQDANCWIYYLSQKKAEYQGMGTTLCSLIFYLDCLILGYVGDSRIYRYREGNLTQLTEDHSLLNEMLKEKPMSQAEIQNFPYKNVLTRALGTEQEVQPEIQVVPIQSNDLYLVCSDGLSDYVPDEEIEKHLSKPLLPKELTDILIRIANQKGGKDNTTVVTIRVQ